MIGLLTEGDGQPSKEALSSQFSGMITPRTVPGGNDRSKSECDDLKLDDKKRKDGAATNGDNSSNGTNAGGIDEDEMLTKLFDTRTPPVIVEAGHQKLLNKFLKSRDENKVRIVQMQTTVRSQ